MKIWIFSLVAFFSTATWSQTDDQRFESCRSKLLKANELEVLHAFDWKPPAPPKVVVGRIFYTIPFDAKEGFAETVNCFLVSGARDKHINFTVRDWQSNKIIGRYFNGKFTMN